MYKVSPEDHQGHSSDPGHVREAEVLLSVHGSRAVLRGHACGSPDPLHLHQVGLPQCVSVQREFVKVLMFVCVCDLSFATWCIILLEVHQKMGTL